MAHACPESPKGLSRIRAAKLISQITSPNTQAVLRTITCADTTANSQPAHSCRRRRKPRPRLRGSVMTSRRLLAEVKAILSSDSARGLSTFCARPRLVGRTQLQVVMSGAKRSGSHLPSSFSPRSIHPEALYNLYHRRIRVQNRGFRSLVSPRAESSWLGMEHMFGPRNVLKHEASSCMKVEAEC